MILRVAGICLAVLVGGLVCQRVFQSRLGATSTSVPVASPKIKASISEFASTTSVPVAPAPVTAPAAPVENAAAAFASPSSSSLQSPPLVASTKIDPSEQVIYLPVGPRNQSPQVQAGYPSEYAPEVSQALAAQSRNIAAAGLMPAALVPQSPAVDLTPSQQERAETLADDFAADVSPESGKTPDPADPAYRKAWNDAKSRSDDRYKALYGWSAYIKQNLEAARPASTPSN